MELSRPPPKSQPSPSSSGNDLDVLPPTLLPKPTDSTSGVSFTHGHSSWPFGGWSGPLIPSLSPSAALSVPQTQLYFPPRNLWQTLRPQWIPRQEKISKSTYTSLLILGYSLKKSSFQHSSVGTLLFLFSCYAMWGNNASRWSTFLLTLEWNRITFSFTRGLSLYSAF